MIAAGVSYIDEGDGPPMILIMGLGAESSAWTPHSRVWSRKFRCIAVDNRGLGESPLGPEPASTANMAQDVVRLMEALELGPSAIVGISMGAGIAQELALARPDLVSKLVLVAPWARCDGYTRSVLSVLGRVHSLGDPRSFNELLRNTIWTPRWVNENGESMEADLSLPLSMASEAFQQQVRACQEHDALARLAELRVPTLVTFGNGDAFIHPELSLEVAAHIPGAEVRIFEGTGHVHHWEELEKFNELIADWTK